MFTDEEVDYIWKKVVEMYRGKCTEIGKITCMECHKQLAYLYFPEKGVNVNSLARPISEDFREFYPILCAECYEKKVRKDKE